MLTAQHLDTVLMVLTQIKNITQDNNELKERYNMKLEIGNDMQLQQQPVLQEYLPSALVWKELNRRVQQDDQSSQRRRRASWKTSLRWVASDRKGFDKLVSDLRELNNGLNALLQESQMRAFRHDFMALCLQSSSSNDVATLETIREASSETYDNLSLVVDQRIHVLSLEEGATSDQEAEPIPFSKISFLQNSPTPTRDIARYDSTTVLIEWRPYDPSDPTTIAILQPRITHLATLLSRKPKPQEFHVLDCLGSTHDEAASRFGLVFQLPALAVSNHPGDMPLVVSLHDLIHTPPSTGKMFPSLNDRFRLSRTLASSLLHLHAAKWLHRNLRSESILFIASSQSVDTLLPTPYISGFEYARPDAQAVASLPLNASAIQAPFQHPDLLVDPGCGYRRDFDAYSLGIILVEIGFWRPIADFFKEKYGPRRNLKRLLENQLMGDLAFRMGTGFEEAVRRVLTARAYGEGEETSEGGGLEAFLVNVVERVDCTGLD